LLLEVHGSSSSSGSAGLEGSEVLVSVGKGASGSVFTESIFVVFTFDGFDVVFGDLRVDGREGSGEGVGERS